MRVLLALLLVITAAGTALASSPGMTEGPSGCSWAARIDDITPESGAAFHITLMQEIGSCMEFVPIAHCGEKNMHFPLTPEAEATEDFFAQGHSVGDIINVWINETGAHLRHPECTTVPIKENVNDRRP